MSEFDCHVFCKDCGAHMRRMPFGYYSRFFDSHPCPRCGSERYGEDLVAKRARVGRWPWQRGWVDRNGRPVPVSEGGTPEEDS